VGGDERVDGGVGQEGGNRHIGIGRRSGQHGALPAVIKVKPNICSHANLAQTFESSTADATPRLSRRASGLAISC
jgi:hypothetical protein